MTDLFVLPTRHYDLAATLDSGQAFRWVARDNGWEGIIGSHWVRLTAHPDGLQAELAAPASPATRQLIRDYLQSDQPLPPILESFPQDEPMRAAVTTCQGLRLLRQDPWECLASFILSSTKQIVQIRQIVAQLCARFGEPVAAPAGREPAFAFPTAARLAACSELELRECKMGFRAPNLLATARLIDSGELALARLFELPLEEARAELTRCPGVGPKIANCVLLFAYGFPQAFPVDVWIKKALQELYFPKRRASDRRLERFIATHFGPHAGYAQQYLFHYMRTRKPVH